MLGASEADLVRLHRRAADLMPSMQLKGKVRQLANGWVCECPGTRPGTGSTAEAAWYAWLQLLPYPPEGEE